MSSRPDIVIAFVGNKIIPKCDEIFVFEIRLQRVEVKINKKIIIVGALLHIYDEHVWYNCSLVEGDEKMDWPKSQSSMECMCCKFLYGLSQTQQVTT